jgi:SAM-dependent methyltransferase
MDAFYPARYRKYGAMTAAALRRIYRWRVHGWSRRFAAPGRALEVGCGDGWMLAALRDNGWHVIGSERAIDSARAAAALNRVATFVGDLEAVSAGPRFQLVLLFQVLEHLADPLVALRRGAGVLEPNGMLLVAVPNFASWQARFFGPSWFHLDVPRHLHHFSPQALTQAMELVGLKVVAVRFASFEHDPFGWIQSALNALGFKQNLLTKWLMGTAGDEATPIALGAMLTIGAVLLVPSVVLAMLSWMARAGATMELWAVKA